MDVLLKKVYSLHKQSLTDVNTELSKCRQRLERLEERNKELETKNAHLSIESKEGNKQTSSGSCCEVVKQSLQEVIVSYKQMLEDKNERIKYLENEVKKYKRRFSTAESLAWDADNNSQQMFQKRLKPLISGASPDSTSRSTPRGKVSRSSGHTAVSPDPRTTFPGGDTETDKSPGETQKLRLQRRGKRSRYSEDISPEMKRPRHNVENSVSQDEAGHKQNRVLVRDTCHPHLDNSMDLTRGTKPLKRRQRLDDTVLVVPETMAVDDGGLEDHLDDEDIASEEFKHKLSNIDEMNEVTDCDVSDVDGVHGDVSGMNELVGGKLTEGDCYIHRSSESIVHKDESIVHKDESRLQKVFDSPEGVGDISGNDSLYEAISDIGVSIVDDSDNNPINTALCTDNQGDVSRTDLNSTHRTHPLGARCKNLKEVDEMFETPDGKNRSDGSKPDDSGAANKKRLFKKSVKTDLKSGEELVLRRSPRKNKNFEVNNRFKSSKSNNLTSKYPGNSAVNNSSSDVNDITIAPEPDHSKSVVTENQSMDLYQIVPVKNGEPVKSKQFQMKVKKNKYNRKGNPRQNNPGPFQSPSVHVGDATETVTVSGPRSAEVITVSSPSVGSLSDPDSPLILKNYGAENNGSKDASRTQKTGPMSGTLKGSPSKATRSSLRRNGSQNSSTAIVVSDRNDTSDSPRSKSVRQTTLTQRFFSPNKNETKDIKLSANNERNKKTLTFGDVAKETDDDEVIVRGHSFSFKKPENPVNRDSITLKKKGRKTVDLDETVQPLDSHVLHDGSSRHLNGSMDPAAELSVLCGEPGSLEHQPGKSLPSLEFCQDDLMSGGSLPKCSTLVAEESEDIPSSYRFMPKKKPKQSPNKENVQTSLDDSFDRPPRKPVDDIAHIAVVRKKDERQKLQGYGCKQCEEYYKSAGRSDEEIKQHMNQCSRHRAQYLPPDTPPHFWSVGFIDTQECVDRGYLRVEDQQEKRDKGGTYRRRRRLNKYFKSKTEGTPASYNDSDEELVYD